MDNNLLNTIMAPFTQSNTKPCSHQPHSPQSFLHFKSNGKHHGTTGTSKNSKTETTNQPKPNETKKSSPQQSQSSETPPTANDDKKCIDNVHFNDLFQNTLTDSSSITMPQSIRYGFVTYYLTPFELCSRFSFGFLSPLAPFSRNDPRLYKDDVDIRFSRTLNSCKLPQIRYASPERLFERLTDLRFLSIDFLNTFLLTYRVIIGFQNCGQPLMPSLNLNFNLNSPLTLKMRSPRCSLME